MRCLACLLIPAILLFFSCSRKDAVPQNLIQQKEMQLVVWDILQADELAMQNKLADSSLVLKNESFRLYDQVFALHKVSRDQFFKTYRYYQEHPGLYKTLMNGVKIVADKQRKAKQTPGR
jgi:hypothetical protein